MARAANRVLGWVSGYLNFDRTATEPVTMYKLDMSVGRKLRENGLKAGSKEMGD